MILSFVVLTLFCLLILAHPSLACLSWTLSQCESALQWTAMLLVVLLYLALQFLLPVPGCPTGYIGPGGRGDDGQFPDCVGGAHGYIDQVLWGDAHIFHRGTCSHAESYRCTDFGPTARGSHGYDPEGTLGVLMAAFECVRGASAARERSPVVLYARRSVCRSCLTLPPSPVLTRPGAGSDSRRGASSSAGSARGTNRRGRSAALAASRRR